MFKMNQNLINRVMDYVTFGENRDAAMDIIYKCIDDKNWRKYSRELNARMTGIMTPEQRARWCVVTEEILFRATAC